MDVFLLGAGRPSCGQRPSALKHIALNTKAIDWQIHGFESIAAVDNIQYLGGYHVDDVIDLYPRLNFTVIPDWQKRSVLHTLLKAPFSGSSAIVSYSDTIFRKKVVQEMVSINADVVFGVDTHWKERFEQRSADDIASAETIKLEDGPNHGRVVEFSGLIYFGEKATQCLKEIDESNVGSTLIHLINYLKESGLSVVSYDVAGEWTELNSPRDVANFILGTKADTLARLEPLVSQCYIGKQVSFTSAQWRKKSSAILDEVFTVFLGASLVVRSSSKSEDNWRSSNAGGFESLLDINGSKRSVVSKAIDTVIQSYGHSSSKHDQVLIQECLQNVQMAGVVFTCGLETGAPYYRFNFDDTSQSTESVTAGTQGDLRTIIVSRFNTEKLEIVEPRLIPVLEAVIELEQLLGFDKLDIEFAINSRGMVHVFQVRPITVDHSEFEIDLTYIESSLNSGVKRFISSQHTPSFSCGTKTIFANMPDWNPAEIIGIRPKPLAFSLYRHLITNDVWAQQRAEYGYRDVRPFPLILSFSGQPFVDVRASLNTFLPAALPEATAERIANAYINILAKNPQYHDKVEFSVAYTVWAPEFSENAKLRLGPYGVTDNDIFLLEGALKEITCKAMVRLRDDIQSIQQLSKRRTKILASSMSAIDKTIALLEDCKCFGTLAFAHAARSGFVAMAWLKSFVATGVLTDDRVLAFLKSFSTVAGDFEKDKKQHAGGKLSQNTLIAKYGHLRPGTYEITAQAYWEDPSCYLTSEEENQNISVSEPEFQFLASELAQFRKILDDLGSALMPQEMVSFLIEAIQSRESVKFEFTKNLSLALDYCIESCSELGLKREDASFLEYSDMEQLKLNVVSMVELNERISSRKQQYLITGLIELPSLIQREDDFYCFERFASQPNFITTNKVIALIQPLFVESKSGCLSGKVILISQADPGYDWLFGHGIAGLITKYGGANSHMAIRAAEIGLPAAIGVGDKLYEQIAMMPQVELDCANETIRQV